MSNAITKVDSKSIGEHEADSNPDEMMRDAMNAAATSSFPSGFELTKVLDRAKVGRFMAASGVSGHVVATAMWYGEILEKAAKVLSKDLENSGDEAQHVATAGALKDVAMAALAAEQTKLKAVEIIAAGSKKKSQKGHAPQTIIMGDRPQIVVQGNQVAATGVKP